MDPCDAGRPSRPDGLPSPSELLAAAVSSSSADPRVVGSGVGSSFAVDGGGRSVGEVGSSSPVTGRGARRSPASETERRGCGR